MRTGILASALVALCMGASSAQEVPSAGETAGLIGKRGTSRAAPQYSGLANDELRSVLAGFSKFANTSYRDSTLTTRGAKEAQIYKDISPSVVMILVKEGKSFGIGSGTLINSNGEILTNWHVIQGAKEVAVLFKPAVDGQKPTDKDIVRGTVMRYDAVADLALVKVNPPANRKVVRLAGKQEIGIGLDVFAIGHPEGDDWTYTKGIISQVRKDYEWVYKDKTKHKADLIQTQTPINPGNSGGPLLSDTGTLVGVNSFGSQGEGLNFAVAVDEINAFLARKGNRETSKLKEEAKPAAKDCEVKVVDSGRTTKNDAAYDAVDTDCDGKADAALIKPDDKTKAIRLAIDTNGDEEADGWIMDADRDGKWDVSFWATKHDGKIDVVGKHPDGSLEPTSFESFDTFKARANAQAKTKP
jgi:S1-C subfamily serine protease